MKTILLKFAGPMQSWGTKSRFENRYTDRYPSKSAIIGLISACLGYRRDETEKIVELNKLDFALRIDQEGRLLKDYHIAQKKNNKGKVERSYVTNRYYLEDAVFVVALGSADESLVDKVEKALKNPYFQPSMGRRALPLNSDFLIGTRTGPVIESLEKLEWQAADWYKKKMAKDGEYSLDIYADAALLGGQGLLFERDLVLSFSQKMRTFGYRPLSRKRLALNAVSDVPGSDTDSGEELSHDAFSAVGGEDVYF